MTKNKTLVPDIPRQLLADYCTKPFVLKLCYRIADFSQSRRAEIFQLAQNTEITCEDDIEALIASVPSQEKPSVPKIAPSAPLAAVDTNSFATVTVPTDTIAQAQLTHVPRPEALFAALDRQSAAFAALTSAKGAPPAFDFSEPLNQPVVSFFHEFYFYSFCQGSIARVKPASVG
jgi:hypothetical protein